MKHTFGIVALALMLSCTCALAKAINPPSADIADVISTAREYLKTRNIDLSHRFLASVEYKDLHSEYERSYWLLTWHSSLAHRKASFTCAFSTVAKSRSHAAIRVFVHPRSNQALQPTAGRRVISL
jgi:hypothetical protein